MADDAISVLNHLIVICRNGQHGFHEAAQSVEDEHLASVLRELSEQREQFAAQLRYQVSRLGGRPEDHGTIVGALHRRWIDLRSAVTGGSARAVITECERGEDLALRSYESATRADLPDDIKALIADQHVQVRAAHDLVRSLELKLKQQPCF